MTDRSSAWRSVASADDRQLLEAAARAAGIAEAWFDEDGYGWPDPSLHWNPLTDDGDALRLAVKLKIDLKFHRDLVIALVRWDLHATELAGEDPNAATRRAIVRAAAAMAKEG